MKWTEVSVGGFNAANQRLWLALGDKASSVAIRLVAEPEFAASVAEFMTRQRTQKRQKLGQILIQQGCLTKGKLHRALRFIGDHLSMGGHRLGEALVKLKMVSDIDVARALATQADLEYVDLNKIGAINTQTLHMMPVDLIRKYQVLPLGREGSHLRVLVHDPQNFETLDNLRFRMACEIDIAVGAKSLMLAFIANHFPVNPRD